ncbi:unnamed protein product [Hydatigera taeniaeformis]|uniref:Uncharacterized protein n=1 Tax=Hydatigena taeniaeformis TaxID=6205 RepID=A0A0R3WSI4_HYDTA|nr:unnamed protein product [Hydatigera taeniaeformis]
MSGEWRGIVDASRCDNRSLATLSSGRLLNASMHSHRSYMSIVAEEHHGAAAAAATAAAAAAAADTQLPTVLAQSTPMRANSACLNAIGLD